MSRSPNQLLRQPFQRGQTTPDLFPSAAERTNGGADRERVWVASVGVLMRPLLLPLPPANSEIGFWIVFPNPSLHAVQDEVNVTNIYMMLRREGGFQGPSIHGGERIHPKVPGIHIYIYIDRFVCCCSRDPSPPQCSGIS